MHTDETRLYAKLTLDYADSPKIAPLSDNAFRTHVEMLLWSRRMLTDGFISEGISKKWRKKSILELCCNDPVRPSLSKTEGGYLIHDFGQHQTTNIDLDAKREAGRKGGQAKAANRKSASETPSKRVAPATESQLPIPSTKVATRAHAEFRVQSTEIQTATDVAVQVPSPPSTAELFAEVWQAWPKKVERKGAEAKFGIAVRGFLGRERELVEMLLAHAGAYAAYRERHLTPGLVPFLNGDRWNDDLAEPDVRGRTKPSVTEQNMNNRAGINERLGGAIRIPDRKAIAS